MLSSSTKQKIDNARNILVGKIPTPTGQVEHITLALMYKFMHDMDELSKSLGGKAKFFAGEYRQYAWKRIMDPGISAHERVNLYSQGLEKMGKNPGLPQLFREIFKRAFLPFRDPEVLSLFLKQIDEFSYDHSEELGNAFEYLLSIMGTQGEAGQLRTPRHIIDFIVKVVDPKKTDRILDPACGTAGFLISAYKHILDENTDKRTNKPGSKLTQAEKTRLSKNFVGYDISHDMVRLSLVNMYLHNFPDPKIYEYDSLTSEEKWDEDFDCILANPPFMSPKGGIRPHRRFQIQANRSEVLFVDYIAEHLTTSGKAGIIVPEGIIFQSSNAYKALRKMLVENHLWAVVSLPAGAFNPYSGVKTSILLMDKVLSKKTHNIIFVRVESDGFDLGAQRRPIDKDDLPQALDILERYKKTCELAKDDKQVAIVVAKGKIAESGDYGLTGERYRETLLRGKQKWPIMPLGDIAEVVSGQSPEGKFYNESGNGLPFYQGKTEFGDIYLKSATTWTTQVTKEAETNDIVMSVRAPVGPVNIVPFNKICVGRGLAVIRTNEELNSIYLFYVLSNIQDDIKKFANGSTFEAINRAQIKQIKIPLPPLDVQQEIVAEIDWYQKIIDGAKQILASYKPEIKIDPRWAKVNLGEISDFKNGLNFTNNSKGEKIKILGVSNFKSNLIAPLESLAEIHIDGELDDACLLHEGDLLFVRSNGNQELVGRSILVPEVRDMISFSGFTIRCRFTHPVVPLFYAYLFKSDFHSKMLKNVGRGANIRNLSQGILQEIQVPLPDLDTQRTIVLQLEEEQKLVEANKKLVEIFERKIKDKIDEVWGKHS